MVPDPRRVAHKITSAPGTATARAQMYSIHDTQGPWSYVEFDDGLRCWVPDSNLNELSEKVSV